MQRSQIIIVAVLAVLAFGLSYAQQLQPETPTAECQTYPVCSACGEGTLLPMNNYSQHGGSVASLWACSNPTCGFFMSTHQHNGRGTVISGKYGPESESIENH